MHIDQGLIKLIEFIKKELLKGKGVHNLSETDNLVEAEVMDSLAIMKLILFLEEEFDVKISDEDMKLENFVSVESIYSMVERKRKGKKGGT